MFLDWEWLSLSICAATVWLAAVAMLDVFASALGLSVVPHTGTIQWWGRHPRPGFWILMGGAAPLALCAVWFAAAGLLVAVRFSPAGVRATIPRRVPDTERIERAKQLIREYEEGQL